jgi:hypothetical protein
MQTENLIAINEFCHKHDIKISFISSLQKKGLIEITTIKGVLYIETEHLLQLEKFVRFYYELNINIEGIETITHMLKRINSMHDEILILKNKLGFYELNE